MMYQSAEKSCRSQPREPTDVSSYSGHYRQMAEKRVHFESHNQHEARASSKLSHDTRAAPRVFLDDGSQRSPLKQT